MVTTSGKNHNYMAKIKKLLIVSVLMSLTVVLAQSGINDLQVAVGSINSDIRGGLMSNILGLLGSIVVIAVGVRVIWMIMQR